MPLTHFIKVAEGGLWEKGRLLMTFIRDNTFFSKATSNLINDRYNTKFYSAYIVTTLYVERDMNQEYKKS